MLIARNAAFSLYLVEGEQARPEAMGQPTYRNKKSTYSRYLQNFSKFICMLPLSFILQCLFTTIFYYLLRLFFFYSFFYDIT